MPVDGQLRTRASAAMDPLAPIADRASKALPSAGVPDYHDRFAAIYDTLYADRDVEADARYCLHLLGLPHPDGGRCHVLDFGCGSGSHVLAFAALGAEATGFDTSAAMIAQARTKRSLPNAGRVRFVAGQFSEFCASLDQCLFDGAVSIFQVFNCMASPGEMLHNLRLIRGRLAPRAKLLIDLWNGAAVFEDDPHPAVRHFPYPGQSGREIVRITIPKVDRVSQRCTLHYRFVTLNKADQGALSEFESVHRLTFLTPLHYRHLFQMTEWAVLDEFRRGAPGTPVTDRDWYISYLLERPA